VGGHAVVFLCKVDPFVGSVLGLSKRTAWFWCLFVVPWSPCLPTLRVRMCLPRRYLRVRLDLRSVPRHSHSVLPPKAPFSLLPDINGFDNSIGFPSFQILGSLHDPSRFSFFNFPSFPPLPLLPNRPGKFSPRRFPLLITGVPLQRRKSQVPFFGNER